MSLDRRTFLKGLVASAAALVLPPTLAENAEDAKRFWPLDATMLGPGEWGMFGPYNSASSFAEWWEWSVPYLPPEELLVVTAIHRDGTRLSVRR